MNNAYVSDKERTKNDRLTDIAVRVTDRYRTKRICTVYETDKTFNEGSKNAFTGHVTDKANIVRYWPHTFTMRYTPVIVSAIVLIF